MLVRLARAYALAGRDTQHLTFYTIVSDGSPSDYGRDDLIT